MAKYDSADLLARCLRGALRPTTDASTDSTDWYALLTEAQDEWTMHLASICPQVLYGDPVLMTSADGGYTYTFGTDADGDNILPMGHVEVRASRTGAVLVPALEWGSAYDFVHEGDKIRWPNGVARSFGSTGPYARFITPPDVIDASTEPTFKPKQGRMLLVYRALAKWARRGGLRDPQAFLDQEREAWLGDPQSGTMGVLGMLKTQFNLSGMAGVAAMDGEAWWRTLDTGAGYPAP